MSYNTSKSAVLQMARSMACELGPKRIRVNTLSPGHIYTKYVPNSIPVILHLLSPISRVRVCIPISNSTQMTARRGHRPESVTVRAPISGALRRIL